MIYNELQISGAAQHSQESAKTASIPCFKSSIRSSKPTILNFDFQNSTSRFVDSRLRVTDLKHRIPSSKLRTGDFTLRTWEFEVQDPRFLSSNRPPEASNRSLRVAICSGAATICRRDACSLGVEPAKRTQAFSKCAPSVVYDRQRRFSSWDNAKGRRNGTRCVVF